MPRPNPNLPGHLLGPFSGGFREVKNNSSSVKAQAPCMNLKTFENGLFSFKAPMVSKPSKQGNVSF
jgi:hypothetical protein